MDDNASSSADNKKLLASDRAAERPWRLILLATWVPTSVILLAHGMIAEQLVPAIGVIPLTTSFLISLLYFAGRLHPRNTIIVCLDLLSMVLYSAILIQGFIAMLDRFHYRRDEWSARWCTHRIIEETIIATFGCAGLMINVSVHAFLVLRQVYLHLAAMDWKPYYPRRRQTHHCPQCTCALSSAERMAWHRSIGIDHVAGSSQGGTGGGRGGDEDVEQAYKDDAEDSGSALGVEATEQTSRLL